MDKLNELYRELCRDRSLSAWSRSRTLDDIAKKLVEEAIEVQEALAAKDFDHSTDELGDVLWTALFLAIVAEEQGASSLAGAIDKALEKLHRRKPWLKANMRLSLEEEAVLWKQAKEDERRGG